MTHNDQWPRYGARMTPQEIETFMRKESQLEDGDYEFIGTPKEERDRIAYAEAYAKRKKRREDIIAAVVLVVLVVALW